MLRDTKHKQSSWFRQRQRAETIIMVNGVTYRSPQDMPEDIRAIWLEYERQMEGRGIDWRQQKRIVLTWSREGKFVNQSITIEGWPRRHKSSPWTLRGTVFLGLALCWVALSFFGFAWQVPPLVLADDNTLLNFLLVLIYAPWVLLFLNAYRRRQAELSNPKSGSDDFMVQIEKRNNLFLNPETSAWKLASTTVITLAATLLVSYYATFGGIAKLLHYTVNQPGEVTATINAKHPHSRKYAHCVPRIQLQGFRHMGDELCVDRKFFDAVKIGDSIRITGSVSRYAIEPDRFELIPKATLSGNGK